jgi:hypothetical protein
MSTIESAFEAQEVKKMGLKTQAGWFTGPKKAANQG